MVERKIAMKSTTAFKVGLAKIDNLWKPGQFDKALALVDRMLDEWPDNPLLMIKKAQLIQLQEDENGPSLEEARAMLERAADLDEDCPLAANELGFFLLAVQDDAAAALDQFKKCEGLLVNLLKECRKGQRAAIGEISQAEVESKGSTPASVPQRRGRARVTKPA
jgi:hypothetical protein